MWEVSIRRPLLTRSTSRLVASTPHRSENLELELMVLHRGAATEESSPSLDGVGLLLCHVADYREFEHLSLIGLHQQDDPQDKLG